MDTAHEIKQKAFSLGFDLCGIARARPLSEYEKVFRKWCDAGLNSNMKWLCRDIGKRFNPSIIIPEVKSVIVTGLSYYTDDIQVEENVPVVSRYALGNDYHTFIEEMLGKLLDFIRELSPGAQGKVFCDSSYVAEKAWAVEAGLGWQGRNSLVINERHGSFMFLGVIYTSIEPDYDSSCRDDKCGKCTTCIDLCPGGAINADRTIDTSRCISNLTIENRKPLDNTTARMAGKLIYGCDICQEVCPWNRMAKPHSIPELKIKEELKNLTLEGWMGMTEEDFKRIFSGTPVYRKGYGKFRNNINMLTGLRQSAS